MRPPRTNRRGAAIPGAASVAERFSGDQLWLRLAIAVSAIIAAVATTAAGSPHPLLVAATVFLASGAAAQPDTLLGLVFILAVAVQWAATVDDYRTPMSLVVALCFLVLHAASACAAASPPQGSFGPGVWRRWIVRTVTVALLTAAAWAVAIALSAEERSGHGLLVGAGLLIVAAFGGWLLASGAVADAPHEPERGGGGRRR